MLVGGKAMDFRGVLVCLPQRGVLLVSMHNGQLYYVRFCADSEQVSMAQPI